jgi:SAM-dependent methyltransferase
VNTGDLMFGLRENGELDPLRCDGHLDTPQEVARMLADLVPVGWCVLDVGCGTGSVSRIIADTRNAKIIGIEPNSHRAAAARARGLAVYQESFTPAIVQRLEPFNVILFADVLEHVADPGSFLQFARRGLLPGGRMVASVPNVAHWSVRLDLLRGRFEYQPVGTESAVRCTISRFDLGPGNSQLSFGVADSSGQWLDIVENAAGFTVEWTNGFRNRELYHRAYGPVVKASEWELLDQLG